MLVTPPDITREAAVMFSADMLASHFMPHGFCYLWNMPLVWLHVISDSLIALAYFAIPASLLWIVRKRRDLPFNWMFVLFGTFIVACGSTHIMEVWNLWHADYWLAGALKALTAAASVSTAILLVRMAPNTLHLPTFTQWAIQRARYEAEVRERKEIELDLRISESNYREQAALLDITHDAIFVRDAKAKIVFWNRGAEHLYGWRKEETVGKTSHDLLHTEFPQPLSEIENQVYETGFWEGRLVHTCRDGRKVIVTSRWAYRPDASGARKQSSNPTAMSPLVSVRKPSSAISSSQPPMPWSSSIAPAAFNWSMLKRSTSSGTRVMNLLADPLSSSFRSAIAMGM
jgi:PAS domain S-box-containing protein